MAMMILVGTIMMKITVNGSTVHGILCACIEICAWLCKQACITHFLVTLCDFPRCCCCLPFSKGIIQELTLLQSSHYSHDLHGYTVCSVNEWCFSIQNLSCSYLTGLLLNAMCQGILRLIYCNFLNIFVVNLPFYQLGNHLLTHIN